MPVMIITPDEWHWVNFSGSKFLIRRVDNKTRTEIRDSSMRKNEKGVIDVDNELLVEKYLNYICKDWKNITDASGKSIPFSKQTLQLLPEKVKLFLLDASNDVEVEDVEVRKEEIKNSKPTPTGSSRTKD